MASMRQLTLAAVMVFALAALVPIMPMAVAAEQPVAAEHNPPGDIPDTQVFVTYDSPLGFRIKVPEGWARDESAQSVRFSDKYNLIQITATSLNIRPTAGSAKVNQVPALENSGRAVKVTKVNNVTLASGAAVLISYTSNSEPNPVTNKQIRLEHDLYLFYRDGRLASLDMAAPQGADNVDAWSLMAKSFRWK